MDKEVIELISTLGEDGLTAFIIYSAVDFSFAALTLSLITWGARTVWKHRDEFKI